MVVKEGRKEAVKARKLLTMNEVHQPLGDADRFYLRRAEGGRGLIVMEDCVRINVNSQGKYG